MGAPQVVSSSSAPAAVVKVGHIDDVQELVRKPHLLLSSSSSSSSSSSCIMIPERFVKGGVASADPRPTTLIPSSSSNSSSIKIPVIDLHKLLTSDLNSPLFLDQLSNLSLACHQWGFFQVAKEMEKVAMEFFMQPLEEKKKYPMAPGGIQGYGQAFVFSEDQKLDWCNMFALGVHPLSIRVPSLWPSKPPHFTETVETYTREMKGLCEKLMKYIGITLNGNADVFDRVFAKGFVQAVRMNYYPPCPRPDLVLGHSPHSDGSFLTVLQQPNFGPPGLQIVNDKNEWVPVAPLPNALVINVGDTIEVLTNGKYKSVEHRAVTDKERDRLSIATFYAPSYEMEIGPLPEMVNEDNPAQFRNYNHGEYSKHYVTSRLQGKKSLDFAKISI